jgi:hypothetical protein
VEHVFQRARQTVELPDNDNIAGAKLVEHAVQLGPVGDAAAARVRLIVWGLNCQHQVEPNPVEMAERYAAEMTVPDWHKRLVCGQRGGRRVEFVATGARR